MDYMEGRGEGGFLALAIRLLTITLKLLHLAPPNLVALCLHLLDTCWQNFHQGVAVVVFELRNLKKLSMQIFLFLFKTIEMVRWVQICAEKDVFRQKSDFSRVLLDSRGVNIEWR